MKLQKDLQSPKCVLCFRHLTSQTREPKPQIAADHRLIVHDQRSDRHPITPLAFPVIIFNYLEFTRISIVQSNRKLFFWPKYPLPVRFWSILFCEDERALRINGSV